MGQQGPHLHAAATCTCGELYVPDARAALIAGCQMRDAGMLGCLDAGRRLLAAGGWNGAVPSQRDDSAQKHTSHPISSHLIPHAVRHRAAASGGQPCAQGKEAAKGQRARAGRVGAAIRRLGGQAGGAGWAVWCLLESRLAGIDLGEDANPLNGVGPLSARCGQTRRRLSPRDPTAWAMEHLLERSTAASLPTLGGARSRRSDWPALGSYPFVRRLAGMPPLERHRAGGQAAGRCENWANAACRMKRSSGPPVHQAGQQPAASSQQSRAPKQASSQQLVASSQQASSSQPAARRSSTPAAHCSHSRTRPAGCFQAVPSSVQQLAALPLLLLPTPLKAPPFDP
ncbi:hypothetical protein AOQ84DRAFT_228671 [Glonium stellatum]|uniref:Uncharacterized protein n=1 Tax=Glonium stellatum TaxID=574774 RepID=A0A8E2JWK8_9PEZI|nr:hypothetical protein AOQ84DRAFT_228671 [Glonium stellatum]